MDEIGVVYYGYVFDASGYGRAARGYLHALKSAGVELSVVDLAHRPRQVAVAVHPAHFARRTREVRRRPAHAWVIVDVGLTHGFHSVLDQPMRLLIQVFHRTRESGCDYRRPTRGGFKQRVAPPFAAM